MKWQIAAIGKPSLAYARQAAEEYGKRLRRYAQVDLLNDWKDAGKEKNGRVLLDATQGALRIALDERGEAWTTEQFVRHAEEWQLSGVKRVAFLVGGADGHGVELREACDRTLALSSLTLQHELALVVLLEQIYRVHTILKGEPYHR